MQTIAKLMTHFSAKPGGGGEGCVGGILQEFPHQVDGSRRGMRDELWKGIMAPSFILLELEVKVSGSLVAKLFQILF